MWKRSSSAALAAFASFVLLAGPELRADGLDPRVPIRIVTTRPELPRRFPDAPGVSFQTRVLEPILAAPVVDGNTLVVAHASGLVVELDTQGRKQKTLRAGSSLALGPVLLASRRRLVVTGDSEAVVLGPSGRVESRQKLVFRELDANALFRST